MSGQTRDYYAPIGYYARFIWLLGIVILTFFLFILEVEDRTVKLLFFISLPFSFAWWTGDHSLMRPESHQLASQVAVGFMMGLGGLWFLTYLVSAIGGGFSLVWGIPSLTPSTLAVVGTSVAIMYQVGVGIIEEGVFRVAIPRLLMGTRGNAGGWIFLSNWIFGLFHWVAYGGDTVSILVAVFAGMIQSLAYFTSRNILGVMLGHTVWNLAASGLLSNTLEFVALGLIVYGGVQYLKLRRRN